jgi:hypothetical protein
MDMATSVRQGRVLLAPYVQMMHLIDRITDSKSRSSFKIVAIRTLPQPV